MNDYFDKLKLRVLGDEHLVSNFTDRAGQFAVGVLAALVILGITAWLSGLLARLTRRALGRVKPLGGSDSTLANFASSVVRYGILIIGLIAAFAQLGVQTASILAVLGAASLAVGLALQGTLNNVAAGVMLLLLRPYRVGDYVELAGKTGNVVTLDLFVTVLNASNGLRLFIPNGKIFGDTIINYTTTGRRRLELEFGVDYEDDLDKGLEVLLACARKDRRVLGDPAPWARVTELRDSSVICKLDCWVASADFVNAGPDLIKASKEALEAAGLHFAYPHQVAVSRDEFVGKPAAKAPVKRKTGKT
ncbi:MAG: mechanosensitive ion channel domain-containing protein [Alphaproteobacteria bacterium]